MNTKHVLILTALSLVTPAASALNYDQFSVDGIIYEKLSFNNEVKVTYDPDKAGQGEFELVGKSYSGTVNVPSTVSYNGITYTVVEVGTKAFSGCPNLTEVTLPETVTTIGVAAFYENPSLLHFTLPSSVRRIESAAFRNCYNLKSITFNDGLEYIGGDAFTHDRALTELTIPASVKHIESYAFCACTGVKRIVMEDAPEMLQKTNLYDYHTIFDQISADYAYIGRTAYTDTNCRPIHTDAKEIVYGDIVTSITPDMFNPATLESITIPASVVSIGRGVFIDCKALKHIVLADGDETLSIAQAVFNQKSNGQGGYSYEYLSCFQNCPLETAYIGRNTKLSDHMGQQAFAYNPSLQSVVVGPKVTTLPDYAFIRCTNLKSVDLSNSSITTIGKACFADNMELSAITIPETVTEIADRTFDGCVKLSSVRMGSSVTSIGEMAFYYCNLNEIIIPQSVENIGSNAFCGNGCANGSKTTAIQLPEGLKTIGERAFDLCNGYTELTIPSTVTTIHRNAFGRNPDLHKLKFADSFDPLYVETETEYSKKYAKCTIDLADSDIEEIYIGRYFNAIGSTDGIAGNIDFRRLFAGERTVYATPLVTFGNKMEFTNNNILSSMPYVENIVCTATYPIPYYYPITTTTRQAQINLYVPKGYTEAYVNQYNWEGFKSVQDYIEPTGMALNETTICLKEGTTTNLHAIFTPSDAVLTDLVWISSDPSVGGVDESGTVTALSDGEATITATLKYFPQITAECKVTVSALSSIAQIEETDFSVYASGNDIVVDGLPAGSMAKVYNLSGIELNNAVSDGKRMEFKALQKGIYVVVTPVKSIKVTVQ